MPDMITVTNPGDGIRLTLFAQGGAIVAQVKLPWRRAALIGSDLVTLAVNESQNEAQSARADKTCPGK